MRSRYHWLPLLLIFVTFVGCGPTTIKPKGQVVLNGKPVELKEGEVLRVGFHELRDGQPWDSFWATPVGETGFEIKGRGNQGISPGTYRISVDILSGRSDNDRLGGAFSTDKSPIIRELGPDDEELTIDIAEPN